MIFNREEKRSHTMSIRCEIGGVLRQVKERSGTQRHSLALVKESCGYKRSYTYWLISLHKLSEQYPLQKDHSASSPDSAELERSEEKDH